jgi:hypothetical protein
MALEVGLISPANIRKVAFGGIILASVELTVIRDNVIEDVGSEHRDQICGIFVLTAIGIEIESNRLRRNGQVAVAGEPLKLGHRGGIIIRFARPPAEPPSFQIGNATFSGEHQDGVPAASIHHNVVVARQGRALFLNGLGPMTVTDNQFTAHGSDFLALLGFLLSSFTGTPLTTGVTTGAASLPPGVSTFDLLLDALGGNAILIVNVGWSNELISRCSDLTLHPGPDQYPRRRHRGSSAATSSSTTTRSCSTRSTRSSRSASVRCCSSLRRRQHGRQPGRLHLAVDFVVVDTLAFGLSAMGNNRLKEGYFNAYLSADLWVVLNPRRTTSPPITSHFGMIQPSAVSGATTISG